VTTALEPWRIEVIALPGNLAGLSSQRARAVAEEQRAGAVIWVKASQEGHVLELYDAHSGQVMSRALPSGPPFSEPVAASLALSIKTMLRNGPLAPAHGRGPGAWARPDLVIDSRVGLRTPEALGPELRFGVALVWRPRFKGSSYGLAAKVDTGLGVSLDVNNFVGSVTEIAFGMEALRRIVLTRRIEVDGLLGGSLRRTYVRGLIGEARREGEILRWNGSADAGLVLRARLLSALYVDAQVIGSYLPRRQDYVLYGMPIISSPRYAVEAGVGFGVAIRW
jgi:hypothetical protein